MFPFLLNLEASKAQRYKWGGVLRCELEVYCQYFSDKLYGLGVPEQFPIMWPSTPTPGPFVPTTRPSVPTAGPSVAISGASVPLAGLFYMLVKVLVMIWGLWLSGPWGV